MRYWLGPNTLGRMDGCSDHLSFDARVPCSKMAIILLMGFLIFGSGTPPGKSLWNKTSHVTDRKSWCLLSLNAQMNSSKAVVTL